MDERVRRESGAARPRRLSAAVAEPGADPNLQDGEESDVYMFGENQFFPGGLSGPGRRMERRNSAQGSHQRHMPMGPLKLTIPRKTKEKKALFHNLSTESREYEDMMTILTSSCVDTSSTGCFTYSRPRLVHSEQLEKEFVEKRKEMKSDGRTDKELEESYCFLLADSVKVPGLCERGLFVGQSWITVLGNPAKGVYLSRYSDLLQVNPMAPGTTGEIIIFKVMKGKVKSIYENMKNLLDPTPRFDSHISKNASKVTSLSCFRSLELTQQYFYEYSFDELRDRPRQVCPHAVVSFHYKGKDSPLPSAPLAPIRMNSQSAEGSTEPLQYTVWSGDLVKGDRVLSQISILSTSPPILPHRLPEKLDIGWSLRLDQVTQLLPSELFSYNLYSSSQEVEAEGRFCSLLEVTDRSRSNASVTRLLHELEMNRVVLVTPLKERGFLFLLSSVQMATPTERGENWKRSLHALFVLSESRDVAGPESPHAASESVSGGAAMPWLQHFVPALHHSLVKARANPPPELAAGVERLSKEYLTGLSDGKVRQYPMGNYESILEEQAKAFPAPKHHRVNLDGYLHSYLYNPVLYLLSLARAQQIVELHCGHREQPEGRLKRSNEGQREAAGKEAASSTRDRQTHDQKVQQMIDLVMTCTRKAENELKRDERGGALAASGSKRRREQETAERALKFLKASQEPGRHARIPVDGNQVSDRLASLMSSIGLKDTDLREDGSELSARLLSLLTDLKQSARGTSNQNLHEGKEEGPKESCPFGRLATKLGLPVNCAMDLRKQDELEEQTAGSVSSLEGFSPSSHSGEMSHYGAAARAGGGGWHGRRADEEEDEGEIPWVLFPITGLCSERYTHRNRNIPQDPRFQRGATATSITPAAKAPRKSPAQSPGPSPPPSPSQCPSPEPSPPPSPSQCPSPEPSTPPSPYQCPSPEASLPPSPSQYPSPQPLAPPFSTPDPSPQLSRPPAQSQEPNEPRPFNKDQSRANEEQLAPAAPRDSAGPPEALGAKPQGRREDEEPSVFKSIQPSVPPAPDGWTRTSAAPTDLPEEVQEMEEESVEEEMEMETQPFEKVPHPRAEAAGEGKQASEEGVERTQVPGQDVEREGETHLQHIDFIVEKHLGSFSSDIQNVLQLERIKYSVAQSSTSTSTSTSTSVVTALQHTPPLTSVSQLSHYVTFYNPCPPVQDYVSSLQDNIDSMLTELDGGWPGLRQSATSSAGPDAALANTVSAFVSGIRAANANTEEDEDGVCAEVPPSEFSQMSASSSGGETWQPQAVKPDPRADNRNPSSTLPSSVTTSGSDSGSGCKPTASPVLCPSPKDTPPQSHWKPQQSRTLEVSIRQTPAKTFTRTVHCPTGTGCETRSGPNATEEPRPSESLSTATPVSTPTSSSGPPSTLNCLIKQLQPEVLNNLLDIMKGVKKNSMHFYLHSPEQGDRVDGAVKEHLLQQGNVEQSPPAFLKQESSDSRLLVVIQNKDIAAHIHQIPGLVSLKRRPTVVFVGIDTLNDIRNKSYNRLFVSGGCIVSDETILNPDFVSHERLTFLLKMLEQNSSPESVWRWKIHCRTHKKLKEQSRFRRDAANLLELLSAYQKKQIVEFLPYHHCDMMNHQTPDPECLVELQARYTQYRHTVLLTEHPCENFPVYSARGIIVANMREILHNFTGLVGYHDVKDSQPIIEDLLAPKENTPSPSFQEEPQHLLQSSSGLPRLSEQLNPDTSCKDLLHPSGKDFEDLRRAISELRARRAQQQMHQQLLDSGAELSVNPPQSFLPDPTRTGRSPTTPLLAEGGPIGPAQLAPAKKAVTATLDLIHTALQLEHGEEQPRGVRPERQTRVESPGGPRVMGPVGGNLVPSSCDRTAPPTNQHSAAVTGPHSQTESTHRGADQPGDSPSPPATEESSASTRGPAHPTETDRPRDTPDQPIRRRRPSGDGVPADGTKLPGGTNREDRPNPAGPGSQLVVQKQTEHQQRLSHLQAPPPRQQQHWGASLLHNPHLHHQPYPHSPLLAPFTTLGGGFLGRAPIWARGLSPAGAAALVWGFQQSGRDLTGSRLLAGFHNPAGQGGNMYRGGQRGGGFNGM